MTLVSTAAQAAPDQPVWDQWRLAAENAEEVRQQVRHVHEPID
jgi:hypothetical protein